MSHCRSSRGFGPGSAGQTSQEIGADVAEPSQGCLRCAGQTEQRFEIGQDQQASLGAPRAPHRLGGLGGLACRRTRLRSARLGGVVEEAVEGVDAARRRGTVVTVALGSGDFLEPGSELRATDRVEEPG